MTSEENVSTTDVPILTDCIGETLNNILNCLKITCVFFKKAIDQSDLLKPLNEDKLTQIFVEQVECKIKSIPNIGVNNQYSDIFFGTKGIPDFYFHIVEEGAVHKPLFVVESKRLPAPEKYREKEYVIGEKKNGGIERYKIEKHGKGLDVCGMLGFIEKEDASYWLSKINEWIEELSLSDSFWNKDEILIEDEIKDNYSYFNSIAHRQTENDLTLYHLWVDIKN